MALPSELTIVQAVDLASTFGRSLVQREECAADLAVRELRPGISIATVLCTTRVFTSGGFTEKIRFTQNTDYRRARGFSASPRADLLEVGKCWAELCNASLKEAGSAARVDHRSLKDQGFGLIPQTHLGSAAARGEDIDRKATSIDRDAHKVTILLESPETVVTLISNSGQAVDMNSIASVIARYVSDPELQSGLVSHTVTVLLPGERDGEELNAP